MSIALTIQSQALDELLEEVDALEAGITSDQIKIAAGTAMKEAIRNHFFALAGDEAHHETATSLGASRTGFYLEAAAGTHDPQIEGEGVSVSVEQEGLAQRLYGGTIEARPGSYLTIPARAEAYGHRAGTFDDLKLIMFPSGLAALVDKEQSADEGTVYYWLVRSVTQRADPTVLPEEAEILDPALSAVRSYVDRIWQRKAA